MDVIQSPAIERSARLSYADLLRQTPRLNVSQTSARDINLTSRGATGTAATGQLVLLDGRSIYQDFFGSVMWDFLPVQLGEIKQIEVIRGPASAVWGPNALHGVVNVLTKPPREIEGTTATFGFGVFDRSIGGSDLGTGALFYMNGTHAEAVNDRWSYKISAGAYTQEALPRPTGVINNVFQTPYPAFENRGTTQPKVDGRVDYELGDAESLSVAGGFAGTDGIFHTGLGPFDVQRGSVLGYVLKSNTLFITQHS